MDLIEYLTSIHKISEGLPNLIGEKYNQSDVRRTFFKKLHNTLRMYYIGFDSKLAEAKLQYCAHLLRSAPPSEKIHIENFGWLNDPKWVDGVYFPHLKLNLVVGAWLCFESSINEIFEVILDEEEKDKVERFPRIKQVLPELQSLKRDGELRGEIEDMESRTHPSISRKYRAILDEVKTRYERDLDIDKEFLEFFGACRNCMHNNFIYLGKDREYEPLGKRFTFHERRPISLDGEYILKMIEELSKIYAEIVRCIDYDGEISDPYVVSDNKKTEDK